MAPDSLWFLLLTFLQNKSIFSIFRFFGEVFSELRKVSWPTRQEATRLTLMVIMLSATIGLFLGLIDMLFARILAIFSGT